MLPPLLTVIILSAGVISLYDGQYLTGFAFVAVAILFAQNQLTKTPNGSTTGLKNTEEKTLNILEKKETKSKSKLTNK